MHRSMNWLDTTRRGAGVEASLLIRSCRHFAYQKHEKSTYPTSFRRQNDSSEEEKKKSHARTPNQERKPFSAKLAAEQTRSFLTNSSAIHPLVRSHADSIHSPRHQQRRHTCLNLLLRIWLLQQHHNAQETRPRSNKPTPRTMTDTHTASTPYPVNTVPSVRRVNVVPSKTPPHKFLQGLKNQTTVWDDSNIARKDLLFVRDCAGGSLTVNAPFAKLLIGTFAFLWE